MHTNGGHWRKVLYKCNKQILNNFSPTLLRLLDYTASLDITSPTFTDLQVRYQIDPSGHLIGVTSSVSSSSVGTLGFLMNLDDDIFKSKIFYQTQHNPENEVDVFKSEIQFNSSEKIRFKVNWKEDGVTDFLQGLKKKMPRIVDALYQAVDKYHHEHTGMKISTTTLKLKDSLRKNVDTVYRDTLSRINELEQELLRNTEKYETLQKKAKKLYHEAADQVHQMNYNHIRAKFFDAAMNTIEEYNIKVKHLIDSAIEFLKITKFQVPGIAEKQTGEELFVLATAKAAEAVDLCITMLHKYFDAFIAFVNELEVQIPASSQIIKGSLVLDEIKEILTHVHKKVNQIFVGIQEIDFAQHLRDLKEVVQQIFQKVEELVRNLRAQNYKYVNTQIKQAFTKLLQGLKNLAENRKYLAPRIENIVQNIIESSSTKLEEILQSLKYLREEYFDPSIVGWSVKYYEIEEKVLAWLKSVINAVVEWHTKYVSDSADLVAHLTERVKEFVENQGEITELSKSAHDQILYWSQAAKKSAAEQNEQVKAKLQEAYEHLSEAYERLIAETKKLIDLTIENYTLFFQYLHQLLNQFESATAETLRPYVIVRQGELRVDIPKPFNLPLFYLPPQEDL